MTIDSEKDLASLKRIGRIVALTVEEMASKLEPGITTAELDAVGRAVLEKHGARSAPRLMYQFPGDTCISINHEAAHGIPGPRRVEAGDLVNIDVSAELDGFFADTGSTFMVPPASRASEKLCQATRSALRRGMAAARAGAMLNEIGLAVETEAARRGFRVARSLTGHGVGRSLHEEPSSILNFYNRMDRRRLKEGQVITIEPFLTPGSGRIAEAPDGWTLYTVDGQPLAQYEHTLVITRGHPIVVTTTEG
ncbi:MAG: type I methionyl aminopeptidase [Anaerolineaceae bacterium]|jgi:methionyl aminopeptidase|nr:type I methionyl aminopeptidase [Anaerolineaceae bacterium]